MKEDTTPKLIKASLYPKTTRVSEGQSKVRITEKLDGSNIAFFKLNGEIYVAQRNNIFKASDASAIGKNLAYKGLVDWLYSNLSLLDLNEGSCICGEWLGMGNIKYTELDKRFYMFAKANVQLDANGLPELYNIVYYHETFIYPFESQVIPSCIGVVPVVVDGEFSPTVENLDKLYDEYNSPNKVEGFIVIQQNSIRKYVRYKDGKPSAHKG